MTTAINDWLRVLIPVAIVFILSYVHEIGVRLDNIEKLQAQGLKYVLLIEQLRKESDDYEARLRYLQADCLNVTTPP